MGVNCLLKIAGAPGESILNTKGDAGADPEGPPGGSYAGWLELQGWDWEVEAETSWTKGGGASVGKPNPGKMNWEHYFDKASPVVLKYIWSGQAFDSMELHMLKGTGKTGQRVFFKMLMEGVFMTKVNQSATEEGNVVQKVEMVFKTVKFMYAQQWSTGAQAGTLSSMSSVSWDIPAGRVS